MLIFESTFVALAQFKDFFAKVSYVFGFLFLKKKLLTISMCRLDFCDLHRFLHQCVKSQRNPFSGFGTISKSSAGNLMV